MIRLAIHSRLDKLEAEFRAVPAQFCN